MYSHNKQIGAAAGVRKGFPAGYQHCCSAQTEAPSLVAQHGAEDLPELLATECVSPGHVLLCHGWQLQCLVNVLQQQMEQQQMRHRQARSIKQSMLHL